jgi:hypothetical protein
LLDRAVKDTTQPIPVVLNLASWARDRNPLTIWLVQAPARHLGGGAEQHLQLGRQGVGPQHERGQPRMALEFVRAAQALGLTLGEIRQIVAFRDQGTAPCAHVSALLQRHAAGLDHRIAELKRLRGEIQGLAERAATLDPAQCPPERVCHIIG